MRWRLQDQAAISGVGNSPYGRDRQASAEAMTIEACAAAIRDAGIDRAAVDGVIGTSSIPAAAVQSGLGLPGCTWRANMSGTFAALVAAGSAAVYSGLCGTALIYHTMYRTAGTSRGAANDPFRQRHGMGSNHPNQSPDSLEGVVAYAAWANRYLQRFGASRHDLARIAINDRTNAADNPNAVLRKPLTMDDYLSSRMVREPLCLYDMDIPVDGADAYVITTADRARDLPREPVYVHAASMGQTAHPEEDQQAELGQTGLEVSARALWARSDIRLADVDLFYPYDGFTIITLAWFEALGYCGLGEAGPFLAGHWDKEQGRLVINGHVRVNTHGGALSEGGSQGSGYFREAVCQLRGDAGPRQVPGATTALVATGGFFFNAGAVMLRTGELHG